MATIGADVYVAHTPITLGLLRNGPAADVVRTARESSLALKYHFGGIRYHAALEGDAGNRIPPCPTCVLLEAQVRSAYGVLIEAAVAEAQQVHTAGAAAGAPAFDADAARTAAAAVPANRLEAIALGAVHTSLVKSYQVAQVDLRSTETKARTLRVTPPAGAADEAAYYTLLTSKTGGWTVALESGHDLAGATAAEQVLLNMAAMSEAEADLAFGLMSMGQVAPVRAGAQLVLDGHHYHSDADASARHRAIEREVMNQRGTEARNVWRANIMVLRNAVWHAGIHFVSAGLLESLAEDVTMPERLDRTGYGTFSVGLPAQEDLFQRAGSYTAVYNQVLQTATAHDHTLDISALTGTVTVLATLPRRGALPAQRPALPGLPAAPWPPGCDTRAKALKLFLEPALDRAEPVAAWMFGFYREICSRAGIRANTQEGSLLRSYSLKRAVANYLGEANRAQEMYSARARFIRAQAEEGKMESYVGKA